MDHQAQQERMIGLVRTFFDRNHTERAGKAATAIEKALGATPAFSSPQVSDLQRTKDERLDFALKIQAKIRTSKACRDKVGKKWEVFRLKAVHVSTILLVPIKALRDGGWLDYNLPQDVLRRRLEEIASLLKHYLTKSQDAIKMAKELRETDQTLKRPHSGKGRAPSKRHTSKPVTSYKDESSGSEAGPSRPSKSAEDPDDTDFQPPPASRKEAEKKKCREREGYKCPFTRNAPGEVTHILPFTWNDTEGAINATEAVIGGFHAFFSDDLCTELHDLLADPADPGSSDEWWNMIYMNAQLHIFWGTAGFGLFCSGLQPHIEPDKADDIDTEPEWDITIQFHWLQHRDVKPTDRIVLEGNDNGFMEMADAQIKYENARSDASKHSRGDGHIDAMAMDTRTTIISGDEFTITMPKEAAFKCKKMLDVQWHLIRIAAMSGAAGYPDLLPDHPRWDKDESKMGVRGDLSPVDEGIRPRREQSERRGRPETPLALRPRTNLPRRDDSQGKLAERQLTSTSPLRQVTTSHSRVRQEDASASPSRRVNSENVRSGDEE